MCTYIDYFLLGCTKTFSSNTTEPLMNKLTAGTLCSNTFVYLGWNLKQNEKYINAQTKSITLEKSKETIQTKFVNLKKKKQELGKFEQENNPEILDGSIGMNNLKISFDICALKAINKNGIINEIK